jgi:tRNA (Thr-GGU) A37 N-methylase
LIARAGTTLKVVGLDVLDGTPVIDIKPYYPPYDVPRGELRVPEYVDRLQF